MAHREEWEKLVGRQVPNKKKTTKIKPKTPDEMDKIVRDQAAAIRGPSVQRPSVQRPRGPFIGTPVIPQPTQPKVRDRRTDTPYIMGDRGISRRPSTPFVPYDDAGNLAGPEFTPAQIKAQRMEAHRKMEVGLGIKRRFVTD